MDFKVTVSDFACALVVLGLGLFIAYWITRLAVRHALRDVGIRGFVIRTEYEYPTAPSAGGDQ